MSHYTTLHKYGNHMHQRKIKMELKNVFVYLYFGFILIKQLFHLCLLYMR